MSHLTGVLGIESPVSESSESDNFFTPLSLFINLHKLHRYTLDPCGHPKSPVTQRILADGGFACILPVDGLAYLWTGHAIFCNPPYSLIDPWVRTALKLMMEGACPTITFLLPANKTEQPWWQQCVEPFRERPASAEQPFVCATEFIAKRIIHGTPSMPDPDSSPNRSGGAGTFGSVLLHYQRLVK